MSGLTRLSRRRQPISVALQASLIPKAALGAALGVRAVVNKRRTLFLADQARIHLDEVAGLGWFIELEIVLGPDQSKTEGRGVADRLMSELGIEPSDLIASAYVDLLANDERNNGVEPAA